MIKNAHKSTLLLALLLLMYVGNYAKFTNTVYALEASTLALGDCLFEISSVTQAQTVTTGTQNVNLHSRVRLSMPKRVQDSNFCSVLYNYMEMGFELVDGRNIVLTNRFDVAQQSDGSYVYELKLTQTYESIAGANAEVKVQAKVIVHTSSGDKSLFAPPITLKNSSRPSVIVDPNANCKTQAYWQVGNGGNKFSQSVVPPGTYQATASFTDCTGYVYFVICPNPNGGAGCSDGLSPLSIDKGTRANVYQLQAVNGKQYYFDVKIDVQGGETGKILATSPKLIVKTGASAPATVTPPSPPAQGNGNSSPNNNEPKSGGGSNVDIKKIKEGVDHHQNPIKASSLLDLGFRLVKGFFVALASFAIVFIMIGAFQLAISRGNPEAVTKAKDTIMWAVVGAVVALLSFSLLAIVQNAIFNIL